MIKKYNVELEGQRNFYESYLRLVDNTLSIDEVFADNTDGTLRGNLLEFKLNINDLNSVLFQAIKYLSAFRIKGKPVPANIILISLNDGKAYHYRSVDYLDYIEQVYLGSASKDNSGFIGGHPISELSYIENPADEAKLTVPKKENLNFGAVITLHEIKNVNRIEEFMHACMLRGYIVSEVEINSQINIYESAQQDIKFE